MSKDAKQANRHAVTGSEKVLPKGAKPLGKSNADERIEVTVLLRARNPLPSAEQLSAADYTPVSQDEFRERFGCSTDDIAKLESFANEHGLSIVQASRSQRTVRVSGTVRDLETAFGVTLRQYQLGRARFRGRKGGITVPKELAGVVEGVFGLDNREQMKPHFRPRSKRPKTRAGSGAAAKDFTPPEVAKLYNFPPHLDGSGQCIAILEFGGGYRVKDMKKYFESLKIALPDIIAISVSGKHNSPTGNPDGPDAEVVLDIQVAASIAPKAKIAVYFAPNTDDGFQNVLKAAVHDTIRRPSVVSLSWGAPEKIGWTKQSMNAFNTACQEAAALGVTVCCSAGDQGAQDQEEPDGPWAYVDFPASSPFVLACGGTRLIASSNHRPQETVWNDSEGGATGGGISEVFPVPPYQANVRIPLSVNAGAAVGRGVPDIAGNADPDTGYRVYVDGKKRIFGGTSAVSPLWAALIAILNQGKGKSVGFLTPKLYRLSTASHALHDITQGDNAAFPPSPGYMASNGWDACTGLGSPDGAALLAAL